MAKPSIIQDQLTIHRQSGPQDTGHQRTIIFGGTATGLYLPGYGTGTPQRRPQGGQRRGTALSAMPETNPAQQAVRQLVPRLASLSFDHTCHTGYWGTASNTDYHQLLGSLTTSDASSKPLDAPLGGTERLLKPMLEESLEHVRSQLAQGAAIGAFFPVIGLDDSRLDDYEDVVECCVDLQADIKAGRFPRTTIVLAAYGSGVDTRQLHRLQRDVGGRKLFDIVYAPSLGQLAGAVAPFFEGGAVRFPFGMQVLRADNGKVITRSSLFTPPMLRFRAPWDTALVLRSTDEQEVSLVFNSDRSDDVPKR